MTDTVRPRWLRAGTGFVRLALLAAAGLLFALEGYTLVVEKEGDAPLPPRFGNFAANRARLEGEPKKGEFTFAVVGDTKSVGVFETICRELRDTPADFGILLGDCSFGGTEDRHRYFRAECAQEYALPFPIFYVVGNHDVSPDRFPVERFEEVYGPSIFSFEYQGCLFIVLRVLDEPFSNADSIAFLRSLRRASLDRYAHTFVFMHIPPPVSPMIRARKFAESGELVRLLASLGIDYVFAGDFHGYARTTLGDVNYVVTGGGGGVLDEEPAGQFHHALVVRVTPDSVDERVLYVPLANDLEDRLERRAISEVWPWMREHPYAVAGVDAVALVALFVAARPPWRRGRRRGLRVPG